MPRKDRQPKRSGPSQPSVKVRHYDRVAQANSTRTANPRNVNPLGAKTFMPPKGPVEIVGFRPDDQDYKPFRRPGGAIVTIATADANECRYPLGAILEPVHRLCGHRTDGSSWCEYHRGRVFSRASGPEIADPASA